MSRGSAASIYPVAGQSARYELREQLAVGGMASVHRAFDRLGRREVAYKRLRIPSEPARARLTTLFQREYDTLSRLSHPSIVDVYDYGFEGDTPYYTMELLPGEDLARRAPVAAKLACSILRDVASALALLHARRLLHRDLSPSNIRITGEDRPKLLDFGALSTFGRPEELVGTPAFIAPEALGDDALDQRADLYALGAVAYWLLTRKLAVRAKTIEQLAEAYALPVLPPSAFQPDVPRALDELVLALLAHDPLARPESAAAVMDRLTVIGGLGPEPDGRRVAYSYLEHPAMVGRDGARAALLAALTDALGGTGRAVVLRGSPGLGRTSLLDELELRAHLAGASVLRADGALRMGRFGIARQLTRVGVALHPGLAGKLREQDSVYILAGEARPELVRSAAEAAQRHARVLSGVLEALVGITEHAPLVILVDDGARSDAESLALLAALTEELGGRRLLQLISVESGAPPEHPHALARLEAASEVVSLEPLDEQGSIALVRAALGDVPNASRLALWLHARTGGNAGQSMDLLRLLLHRGAIRYTLGTFTLPHDVPDELAAELPPDVRLARLEDVGPVARRTAELLSLHEEPLAAELCAAALGLPAHEVLLGLEELDKRGVVAAGSAGFALGSDALRAVVARKLDATYARTLHHGLARALRARGESGIAARFAEAKHLFAAGQAREAAELVERAAREHRLDTEVLPKSVALLEQALAVRRSEGHSDEACLDLLVPIVRAGFYGDLSAQTRHIERTLAALSELTGVALARKLRPILGGRLALAAGFLSARLRAKLDPRSESSHADLLADLLSIASAGTGAAVSAFDAPTAHRIASWLEPLDVLPPRHPGALVREMCLAVTEVSAGRYGAALARYERVHPLLERPVPGMAEDFREVLRLGALSGRAQSYSVLGAPRTLELADELARGTPFYKPLAEAARMAYFAQRADQERVDEHRARAELLALRGGTSWAAVTVLTVRLAYGYVASRNVVGLVQVIAELDRLSAIAPRLSLTKTVCEACLELFRGRPAEAVQVFERVIDTEAARTLSTSRMDRALYARALVDAGQPERAKQVCLDLIATTAKYPPGTMRAIRSDLHALALAEAALGNLPRAVALMDDLLTYARGCDNPFVLGSVHRDRAAIALRARDREAFELHFAGMRECFAATRNPSLIQQCDALLGRAVQVGLRKAPSRPPSRPRLSTLTDDPDFHTELELQPPENDVGERGE